MKKQIMLKDRTQAGLPLDERYEALKQMLLSRQRELLNELHGKLRNVRDEGSQQDRGRLNPGDTSDIEIQDDLEFVLIQMKAETANKISEALGRLDEGTYGLCFECGEPIAEARLRALPFALRCKDCEETIEMTEQRERVRSRRGSSPLGFEMRD